MTAHTVSTRTTSVFNLAASDWLTVTRFGTIDAFSNNSGAVVGAGGNAIQVDGSIINTYTLGASSGILLSGGNDAVVVGATGFVQGFAVGVEIHGNNNAISCAGTIKGINGVGIDIEGATNAISIAATGLVLGHFLGITAAGSTTFTNSGTVISTISDGLSLYSGGNTVVNAGRIDAGQFGITLGFITAVGSNSITNTGIIRSNSLSINYNTDTALYNTGTIESLATVFGPISGTANGARGTLINDGLMVGPTVLWLGNNADTIVNNGLMHGAAFGSGLGGGNDLFDGRLGVQVGLINGHAGNDTIYGGAQSDMLAGGLDNDTLYGMGGIDALAGGDGVDTLFGGDGADNLMGEGGTDLIYGGAGGDVIRGGLGGDLIVFNAGDNGDLIQNFNEGGTRDGFDLRGYFNATGYTGTTPRAAGIMAVLQNGADTDVYLHGAFAFRIQGVAAAAIDDTYFLFQ